MIPQDTMTILETLPIIAGLIALFGFAIVQAVAGIFERY